MTTLRSHVRVLAASLGLIALLGSAIVAALFATGEIGGRTLKGEITIVESQIARLDRELHANLAGPTRPSVAEDRALCLTLAKKVDLAPHHPVVLYDETGSVLGRSVLGATQFHTSSPTPAHTDIQVCRLPFRIEDIRRSRTVTIEIGSRERGTFDVGDLDARGWYLELAAGS